MNPQIEAELQAHAHALRALARLLVGEGSADDLVQDTALAVLRSPPPEAAGLRRWLAQVLRRLASNHRRAAARRQRREHRIEPPQSSEPTASIVERHEAVQRVTSALLGLPEPYHGTLLLRFFEDLTPTAIADLTGVPLATVKSRLQRGLALLRERLDAEAKGEDWRLALTVVFGLPHTGPVGTATAVATVTTGVLLMGSGVKLAIAAAAVVAATAFLWLQAEPPPFPSTQTAAAVAGAPVVAALPVTAPQGEVTPAPPERAEVPAGALAASSLGTLATLRGRCVDEHGHPIAGVQVELSSNARSSESMDAWTKDHEVPPEIDEKSTTDSDGSFAFRFWPPPPLQFWLKLRHTERVAIDGHLSMLPEGETKDLGDVVMPRGVLVRGRVVDTDGAPVAETDVGFAGEEQGGGEIQVRTNIDGRTLADGTFRAGWPLPPGEYAIRVRPQRKTAPDRVSLDGSQAIVDLVVVVDKIAVDARALICGVVVDETGQPVGGARVGLTSYMRSADHRDASDTSTDREGRFVLKQPDRAASEVSLLVQKSGFEMLSPEEKFAWGRDDVRLVLRRGLAVEVTVVADDDGTPVEDFQVRVFPDPDQHGMAGDQYSTRARGHHPAGRVTIEGITRGDWCVLVEPRGERLAMSAMVPLHVSDAGSGRTTVRLRRRIERQLRVQFADGAPVAGTRVELGDMRGQTPQADTGAHPITSMLWMQRNTALLLHGAVTDARGEALLLGPAGVSLTLFVRGPGHVPCVQSEVQLGGDGPLVVTVGAGARLVGKVGPPAAIAELRRLADLPETGPVDADRIHSLPGVRLVQVAAASWRHFPRNDSCAIAEDGTFAIEGAPPGRWDVTATWFERHGDGGLRKSYLGKMATIAIVDLRDGATSEVTLDLSPLLPGEIDALVLHNGKPAAGLGLQLKAIVGKSPAGNDEEYTREVTTDAEGRFRLRTRPGDYEIIDWTRRTTLRAAERAFVAARQTTTQTFRLQSGTLRLRLLDAQGKPARGVRVDIRAVDANREMGWSWLPRTDADGVTSVEADILPFELAVLPRRMQEPKAQQELLQQSGNLDPFADLRLELRRVTPKAGETTGIELRLPADWDR